MPMYDYICSRCGKFMVRIRPIGTDTIECEECCGEANKVPSVPAKTTVGKYGKGGGK